MGGLLWKKRIKKLKLPQSYNERYACGIADNGGLVLGLKVVSNLLFWFIITANIP